MLAVALAAAITSWSSEAVRPVAVSLKGTGARVRVRVDGRIGRTARLPADGRDYRVRLRRAGGTTPGSSSAPAPSSQA